MENIPSTKQEILEQTPKVVVEIGGSRYAKLVAEKQMAGLSREMAEQVATEQLKRDALAAQEEAERKLKVPAPRPLTPAEQRQFADDKEADLATSGLNSNAAQVPQNDSPKSTPVEVKTKDKTAKA